VGESTELRWPAVYEATRGRPAWPLVIEAAAPAPGKRALDLGAGAGRDSRFLLEQGFQVTAVDASPGAANELAALPHQERMRIVTARIEEFEIDL
jgi:tellurite methyltransferase